MVQFAWTRSTKENSLKIWFMLKEKNINWRFVTLHGMVIQVCLFWDSCSIFCKSNWHLKSFSATYLGLVVLCDKTHNWKAVGSNTSGNKLSRWINYHISLLWKLYRCLKSPETDFKIGRGSPKLTKSKRAGSRCCGKYAVSNKNTLEINVSVYTKLNKRVPPPWVEPFTTVFTTQTHFKTDAQQWHRTMGLTKYIHFIRLSSSFIRRRIKAGTNVVNRFLPCLTLSIE